MGGLAWCTVDGTAVAGVREKGGTILNKSPPLCYLRGVLRQPAPLLDDDRFAGPEPPSDVDENDAAFDLDGKGGEIDAHRRTQRLACGNVEPPLMQRAFDNGADNDSVLKMSLLMGAVCSGGEESLFRVVDCERPAMVIPANDILFVDAVSRADFDPLAHGRPSRSGFAGKKRVFERIARQSNRARLGDEHLILQFDALDAADLTDIALSADHHTGFELAVIVIFMIRRMEDDRPLVSHAHTVRRTGIGLVAEAELLNMAGGVIQAACSSVRDRGLAAKGLA